MEAWLRPIGHWQSRKWTPKAPDGGSAPGLVPFVMRELLVHVDSVERRTRKRQLVFRGQTGFLLFASTVSSSFAVRFLCWSPMLPTHFKILYAFPWVFKSRLLKRDNAAKKVLKLKLGKRCLQRCAWENRLLCPLWLPSSSFPFCHQEATRLSPGRTRAQAAGQWLLR